MNVLAVHNHYREPGGEDQVFAAEIELLARHGHEVVAFTRHNDDTEHISAPAMALKTIWNADTYRRLRALIEAARPDVMHVHNTLPLVSPAAYHAAHDAGVTVVQTLHNYRLLCPAATFLREGRICEDCLGRTVAWPGVVHGCYRSSIAATAVVASTLAFHRWRGTFAGAVDRYIALTRFGREKFVQGGLPAERISVRPNFLADDPGAGEGSGGYALFVGRLAPEKGVATLLDAWREVGNRVPLRIAGDGPLAAEVAAAAGSVPGVVWLGRLPRAAVMRQMRDAMLMVLPSEVYEAFPLTIVEAFAAGTPVIATDLGAMREVVEHGVSGLHFRRGDPAHLARQVLAAAAPGGERDRLRAGARAAFEAHYTAERAHASLMDIYALARADRRARRSGRPASG